MEEVISYVSLAIGVASFGFAVYQTNEKRKLNEYVRANNWFNYQRMENTNGTVQLAKRLYLEKHKDNLVPELLDRLSMADAHGQELLKESIRQIQIAEPSFRSKDIERWKKEGKISEAKEKLFTQFSIDAELSAP
ncbi:hypothetical protein PVT68_01440 [Microbulbifer bruguierae]|uniref:Uncharacterized protein n=1 Tax=Microbulbifer bruguierae TaxID=3029061 RepID=A0ABY8NEE8_9GAMM|nr:hypothetical protein [Microbulbifer bruguierae]WGL16977.1 hypothetical protein PVT68_01440 [Microbulbifer bruguierae]